MEKEDYDQSNLVTFPEYLGSRVLTLYRSITKYYDDLQHMYDPQYVGQSTILRTTNVHVN